MQAAAGENRELHDLQFWQAKSSSNQQADSNDKLKQILLQKKANEEEKKRELKEMAYNRGDIEAAHQLSNEMLDASNELVKEMEEIDNQKYLSDA